MKIIYFFKNNIFQIIIIGFFLVGINLLLVYPLFMGGYTQNMGSIEPVFMADARHLMENFPHHLWQPYWYGGFPFHLSYTPIVPYLLALLNRVFSFISLTSWYRILLGLAYAFTPFALFIFSRYLLKSKVKAFVAAFSYSLVSLPAFFFSGIRATSESFGQAPWSILTAVLYGEGPHVMSMVFLPFALLYLLKALREPSARPKILAAVFIALVALTNWITLVGLAVMSVILLFTEMITGEAGKKFKKAWQVALLAYGFSAFWLNYSFIKASLSISSGGASGGILGNYSSLVPLAVIIFPLIIFLVLYFKKRKHLQPLLMAGGWFIIFYLAAYFWFKSEKMLLPQPNRYIPEMGLSAAIIFAFLFGLVWDKLAKKNTASRIGKIVIFILVFALIIFGGRDYLRSLYDNLNPKVDTRGYLSSFQKNIMPAENIESTSEYRIAQWLKQNTAREERVFLTGSQAFWLNTFVDVWQIRGGNEGVANVWTQHATYQIYHEPDADISLDWAKVFNIGYFLVNYPESDNAFHDYIIPSKFVGLLPEVYNNKGDVIYRVNLKYPGLAQVVDALSIEELETPLKGDDRKNIRTYAYWVDTGAKREALINWKNNDDFTVSAEIKEGEALQLQMTYNKGWRATFNGRSVKINKDVIGNMYLIPRDYGQVEIHFKYGRTFDVWLGYLITFTTFIWIIYQFYLLRKSRAKHKNKTSRRKQ